ncbi:TetR/AcrR family transcriptional regulator [Vibrio campbellii]|uniref:TetR/AcrR family transcriptional regulator n=1 Tax=Vibrio campbellii TaxID=680 RepID=UPI0009B6AFA8|nr:TetR/AcrR family transcriptional regulator [Vibrio campbellii]
MELGFSGANVDRVHERAGATKRTLYRHFENKEVLLENWLKEAIADTKVKAYDPAMMSSMLMCLLKGNCLWPQLVANQAVPSVEQRKKIVEDILTLFLDGYRY